MNPTIKSILIISAKNAVNAVLVNGALMAMLPTVFQLHNKAGLIAIGKAIISTVGSREAMVWVPKLIKWSTTNGGQQ